MNLSVVIPALQPPPTLVAFVEALAVTDFSLIAVVDDGSGAGYAEIFDRLRVIPNVAVISHRSNLGKGAALKSGISTVLSLRPDAAGVVTADADGQHTAGDVIAVGRALEREPGALILGARRLAPAPLRSRAGNALTRVVMRVVEGQNLRDTQTGLRGIPRTLALEMMRASSSGYEFELDMLIAAKHLGYPIREVPVQTIYFEGNRRSHFDPVIDSMRIYFVLLRFSLVSLTSALVDNGVFLALFFSTGMIWQAQAAGRLAGILFNYPLARRAVFLSRRPLVATLPKYLALAASSGLASYVLLRGFMAWFGLRAPWAKILADTLLFAVNFTVQRDLIFVARPRRAPPDRSAPA